MPLPTRQALNYTQSLRPTPPVTKVILNGPKSTSWVWWNLDKPISWAWPLKCGLAAGCLPRALWLAKRQAQSRIYRLQVPKVLGTMQRPGTLNILNQPLNEQPH